MELLARLMARMTESKTQEPQADGSPKPNIALCLSGGGFRATFFHLGVIKLLIDCGELEKVTHIFSVSGGSILAAHLALNWEKYLSSKGKNDLFVEISSELGRFGLLDVRGRIVRRWLLFGWLSQYRRIGQLEFYYSKLFLESKLNELPENPQFHFLATSMTTGNLCCFKREHFLYTKELPEGKLAVIRDPIGSLPLATAVAASSAFPPLFPPLNLTQERLNIAKPEINYPDRLTDGGVFDNIGIAHLRRLAQIKEMKFDKIIISDASAMFGYKTSSHFWWIVSRTARMADILMERVAQLESLIFYQDSSSIIKISIDQLVDKNTTNSKVLLESNVAHSSSSPFYIQDKDVQPYLKQVRTDLDRFSIEFNGYPSSSWIWSSTKRNSR
jgi:predicted acylesterase/phospholipase RssA